jgi:hypothetical protein
MGDPYPGKVKYEGKPKQLTWEQTIASLALGGWPESLWVKAAAVIDAESARMINIYNTYLEGHWGLMQIGKKQHPGLFKSPLVWMVPYLNTQEGYRIYKAQGWNAWEAHSNGRYTGGILQATAAHASVKARKNASKLPAAEFYNSLYGKDAQGYINLMAGSAMAGVNKSIGDSLGAGGEALGDAIVDSGAAAAQAAQNQAGAITGGMQLMLGAAKVLTNPDNWIRAAQVLVGAALLIGGIGIVAKPMIKAAPTAKAAKAGKAIASKVKTAAAAKSKPAAKPAPKPKPAGKKA